jgi:hypothetical protein
VTPGRDWGGERGMNLVDRARLSACKRLWEAIERFLNLRKI